MVEKKEFVWEDYGLSTEKAAKMAGLLTWYINRATDDGIKEAELIERIYNLLKHHRFSEREIAFGMYVAGNYLLAIKTISGNPMLPLMWYTEVINAHSELTDNIKKYTKMFSRAVAEKADIERDVI